MKTKKTEISEADFVNIMTSLNNQFNIDRKCSEAFSKILPNDYITGYDNSSLFEGIIQFLKVIFDDLNDSTIDYFIYELEFGAKYKPGCFLINEKDIPLRTFSDLYNCLIYR